jgi:hypothetical protein
MPLQIRPSQFITTYGPGAILEGPDGPRVIFALSALFGDNGAFSNQVVRYEIPEPRLAALLGPTAGIVRIPTNAELGVAETREIYPTTRFPTWSLCPSHNIVYPMRRGQTQGCPRCPVNGAWDRATREAIRFVLACTRGHLDDVPWPNIIRHRFPNCSPSHLLWVGGGAALRFVEIRCPDCCESASLGTAYSRDWPCSGRHPERGIPLNEPNARPGCNAPARMLQKGAANLRMPVVQAALTIPRLDTRLHLFLSQLTVKSALTAMPPVSMEMLLDMLRRLEKSGSVASAGISMVASLPWSQVADAINDVVSPVVPTTYQELLVQEFRQLRNAAEYGAPAQASSVPGGPPCFEVIRGDVRSGVAGPNGVRFRIAPVSRLRVVLVQQGFQRLDSTGVEVSNAYHDQVGNRHWYPGVELFGEGIFIQLDPNTPDSERLALRGADAAAWIHAWATGDPAITQHETHPVHVWWHTLAHRLINALAVDSGYSSAAIRERVYIDVDRSTGEAVGGILLFTTQPGGDGTLGGLIGLVSDFDHILSSALRDDIACSNDPLCAEEHFDSSRVNGSACYACLLVSETSCEHRNRWLDRGLLVANCP